MHTLPSEIVIDILKKSMLANLYDFRNISGVSNFWNNKCGLFKPACQKLYIEKLLINSQHLIKLIEADQCNHLPEKTYCINNVKFDKLNERASTNQEYIAKIQAVRSAYITKCKNTGDAGQLELVKMHFSKLTKSMFVSLGLDDYLFYKSFFTYNERSLSAGVALLSAMNKEEDDPAKSLHDATSSNSLFKILLQEEQSLAATVYDPASPGTTLK